MGIRTPKCLHIDVLSGNRSNDVGSGNEHLAGTLGHDDEIRQRGRVHGPAGTGTQNDADLRNDAAGLSVAPEEFAVGREAVYAFLNARAARIVQTNDRYAGLHAQIHDLGDLLPDRFRKRAA